MDGFFALTEGAILLSELYILCLLFEFMNMSLAENWTIIDEFDLHYISAHEYT